MFGSTSLQRKARLVVILEIADRSSRSFWRRALYLRVAADFPVAGGTGD